MARAKPKTTPCTEDELRAVIDAIPASVWTISPHGEIEFLNRRVLDYFGLPAEDMPGWNWKRCVHPEDLAQYVSDRRAAFASGQPLEKEIRLRRADGQYRWWLMRLVPQRNKSGEIVKWYGTAFDIEDRKHAEEAALEQRLLERTRIARELHDTLLQSFQAVLLKFHAVTYQLSDRPELQRTLEGAIDQARQAVTEGRDAVQGLRSSTVITNDLARAIRILCAELADQGNTHAQFFGSMWKVHHGTLCRSCETIFIAVRARRFATHSTTLTRGVSKCKSSMIIENFACASGTMATALIREFLSLGRERDTMDCPAFRNAPSC